MAPSIRFTELSAKLTKAPPRVTLVSGDEALLIQDAISRIRQAIASPDTEIRHFHCQNAQHWEALEAWLKERSLLSSKRCALVHIPDFRAHQAIAKVSERILSTLGQDCYLLFQCPKLSAAQKKGKTLAPILDRALHIPIWPLEGRELWAWAEDKAKRLSLTLNPAQLQAICQGCQGDALSISQSLERYALLKLDNAPLKLQDFITSPNATESFAGIEAVLDGQAQGLVALQPLIRNPSQALGVLSALQSQLLQLAALKGVFELKPPPAMWPKRQAQLRRWASRIPTDTLLGHLDRCCELERTLKGFEPGPYRVCLNELLVNVCQNA